jgi:polyisoprenoid-binding protein YceI
MKRARIGMFAVAVLAMATVAFAQKPDFSGTWTLDPEASAMGQGGGQRMGGTAAPMVVKQTADTLTTETTRGENKVTMTYKLDGTESTNTGMGRGGVATESKSMAKWDGNKLVITTKTGENESVATWSLDGANLVIEGTGGRGPTKRVYKKTT